MSYHSPLTYSPLTLLKTTFKGERSVATLSPKSLVSKLNNTCRRALEGAAGLCLSRTNYNVEVEHWLIKLLEPADTDLTKILRHYGVDSGRVTRELTKSLDHLKTGNARAPELSPDIMDLITEAWMLTSLEYSSFRIRSGYLLAAVLTERGLSQRIRGASPELNKISGEKLEKEVRELIGGTIEDEAEVGEMPPEGVPGQPGVPSASSKTPALDQFTLNLTERARKGEIDPVIGRDEEIRQVVDILMRRRQNNPILTGEAGVGKTAVVEGFALRIVAGDVPPALKDVTLRTLDIGLLQAGASMKGEFEQRLRQVIEEVQQSPKPIILFIDEAHTLISAGGAAGTGDAANLLKPALARGTLRTVAATTWDEYKKHIEKDPALTRRFQTVKIDEPSEEKGILMMRGIVAPLEKHHKVQILDEAIEAAVRLSHRYIPARQLPDKSVSLIDTACARVAVSQHAVPAEADDCRRRIQALETELEILRRESAVGLDHQERLADLTDQLAKEGTTLASLEKHWSEEKTLVKRILELRAQLRAAGSTIEGR